MSNNKNTKKRNEEENNFKTIHEMHEEHILGVKINFINSIDDALYIIESFLKDKDTSNHLICTTNAEFIVDAQKDKEFKDIINNSSLSLPDGIGVLFARYYLEQAEKYNSKLIKILLFFKVIVDIVINNKEIGEKVSGVDLTTEILKKSLKNEYTAFFLGGMVTNFFGYKIDPQPYDISTRAATNVKKMYPNIKIIGSTSQFSRDIKDDMKTVEYIKECMKKNNIDVLDFLFVGYNHKHQEKWIIRNSSKIPAKVSIGVGGTLDYLSGHLKRPKSYKYEWLKKLIYRPTKFKRIYKAVFTFSYLLIKYSINQNSKSIK